MPQNRFPTRPSQYGQIFSSKASFKCLSCGFCEVMSPHDSVKILWEETAARPSTLVLASFPVCRQHVGKGTRFGLYANHETGNGGPWRSVTTIHCGSTP